MLADDGPVYNTSSLAVSQSSISTLDSEETSDEPGRRERSTMGSFTTIMSEGSHDDDFHHDASSSIFDALQRSEGSDIVQIELQGLRMGEDADYHRVRKAIIAAFMKRIQHVVEAESIGTGAAVSQVLRKYPVVFEKAIFDKDKDVKADQVDFLLSLQRDLAQRERGESLLLFTAKDLYDMDVLEEDGFNQWWQDQRSTADAEMTRVRAQTAPFIDWLATAVEEESEEESEGD